MFWLSRGWIDSAHAAGAAGRDAQAASLGEQRDAAAARADEFAARVERYERDWSQAEHTLREVSSRAAAHQAQAERLGHELADARRSRDDAQARLVDLTRQHAALEAGSTAQSQAATEKLHLLEQAELRLREAFQNLANRILEDKAERFREQSAVQLGGLIDPLKLQLKEFRESITQTHANDQRERGMLAQEIQTLKQLNQRISEDAINLTRALKGDTRSQGAWGELVLERVLEASGLQEGREYTTQASFSDTEGSRQRPDVIVRLPEDKDIVIDAKVSLVAYERFCSAADDAARASALVEHVGSLRRHIDGLSARNYDDIDGLRTLDFVLLFIPIEAAFIEAVRADDRLYTHALAKNISLVSPSTLLATLRTVAHLWRIERRNVNAMEIARRAAQLHDNFALLVDELVSIGTQLDKAKNAHASAMRRLTEGGKGSVLLQVQSLAEMGAPVKKSLPAGLLNSAGAISGDESAGEAPSAVG
ncbi:DNA recombination protein RmuC [Dokdonella sp.]|uniref:DNA recombination protein RmuC n=1 Tax=Dokdonella sp. TaxID=2291710 RepID=UPI0032636E9A